MQTETKGNQVGRKDGFRTGLTHQVLQLVYEERLRQYHKYGNQRMVLNEGYLVLAEEVGEVAKAILEQKPDEYFLELLQVAAVAVQLVEDHLEQQDNESALAELREKHSLGQ